MDVCLFFDNIDLQKLLAKYQLEVATSNITETKNTQNQTIVNLICNETKIETTC